MIRLQVIVFLLFCTVSAVAAQDMPAERYPAGDTVMESPLLFFWPSYEDIAETSYSISIESNTKKIFESGVSPKRYKRYLYFLCDPVLSDGDYSYKIQCNRTGKPYTLPFYGAYSFPITGTFSLSNQSKRVITIPSCIDSIVNEREKKFSQFDNAVFYFSGGLTSLAISALFFTLVDYPPYSTIAGIFFACGAVTGISLGGYYTTLYLLPAKETENESSSDIFKGVSVAVESRF